MNVCARSLNILSGKRNFDNAIVYERATWATQVGQSLGGKPFFFIDPRIRSTLFVRLLAGRLRKEQKLPKQQDSSFEHKKCKKVFKVS